MGVWELVAVAGEHHAPDIQVPPAGTPGEVGVIRIPGQLRKVRLDRGTDLFRPRTYRAE